MQGKVYYGGQTTTFHNTGGKIDRDVVDMHQAALRILFGSSHKPLLKELQIQADADVFIDFDELRSYHQQIRLFLEHPQFAMHADQVTASLDFDKAADMISRFAAKLESPDERAMLQAQCLLGKLQCAIIRGAGPDDQALQQLQADLLEKARAISAPGMRRKLFDYFQSQKWEISYDELFALEDPSASDLARHDTQPT
jgi:hypothetical protein